MKTLAQLANATDLFRQQNARYVKLLQLKAGYLQNGKAFVACKSYSTHEVRSDGRLQRKQSPSRYVTVIVFEDKQLHCKVSCSCSDYMYRYEVANSLKDAADIEYSNSELPTTTNPQLQTSLCKHLYKLYQQVEHQLNQAKKK